jgi:hypothetical protein
VCTHTLLWTHKNTRGSDVSPSWDLYQHVRRARSVCSSVGKSWISWAEHTRNPSNDLHPMTIPFLLQVLVRKMTIDGRWHNSHIWGIFLCSVTSFYLLKKPVSFFPMITFLSKKIHTSEIFLELSIWQSGPLILLLFARLLSSSEDPFQGIQSSNPYVHTVGSPRTGSPSPKPIFP